MSTDFSAEYSKRSDDELLQLKSERHSLITEAADALDAELHRRNLTESDGVEHLRFVKKQEQRETKRQRAKVRGWRFGYLRGLTRVDLLWWLAAVAVISYIYLALPSRDRMGPDWQDAAVIVMLTSVGIAIASRRLLSRKFAFWISLLISSTIHLVVVHAFTQRLGDLNHSQGRGASVLGLLLFLAVYGSIWLLQRMLYGRKASGNAQ
jgi:hypothetical protein